ncbi:hypothetical protein I3843_12G020000 [Carya illinoinensis]|uniref:Uncharacterized protein n=1 Tax=Carya illinoinensis TaxID=32201 RepID=A0A922DFP7_CARIL|nr:hypothetical protein I3842_12G019000 [Carya illinoinensis]KAG7951683.1 hypothetical protein I3843_12G020000 [Carya illinoinensis]
MPIANLCLCLETESQYIGIDFQEPYLEAHLDVENGSIKSYPSNGINFASAGSGVFHKQTRTRKLRR